MKPIRIPSRSKFNVRTDAAGKAARTIDGVVYDSKAEANYAALLALEMRVGEIQFIRRQVPLNLAANGIPICKIVVDFEVMRKDGSVEYVEVKGAETAVYRLKLKLLKACYPQIKLRVVKAK